MTIRNESDGTPSLSGMDENTDISDNENSDNGNSDTDDSQILSDEDDQSDEEDDLSDEKEKARQKSVVAKKARIAPLLLDEPKRLSVKDRLGIRRATSPVAIKIASQIARDATTKRPRSPPPAKSRDAGVSPEKRRRQPPSLEKTSRDRENSRGRDNSRSRDNSRGRDTKSTNARYCTVKLFTNVVCTDIEV